MAQTFYNRPRPESWPKFKLHSSRPWLRPFLFAEWVTQWLAYGMGNWSLMEVLDYLGRFSVLAAVVFYFAGAGDRMEQKHYQAWQVINTAQGRGGSGGRLDALRELNEDQVPLVGIDVSDAFLQGVRLEHANLRRGVFRACDLRDARLAGADFDGSEMQFANLRQADLENADLRNTDLADADLTGAALRGADVESAVLRRADLRGTDLAELKNWKAIRSVQAANVAGVKNVPEGFVAWAMAKGAVAIASDAEWARQQAASTRPTTQ